MLLVLLRGGVVGIGRRGGGVLLRGGVVGIIEGGGGVLWYLGRGYGGLEEGVRVSHVESEDLLR